MALVLFTTFLHVGQHNCSPPCVHNEGIEGNRGTAPLILNSTQNGI